MALSIESRFSGPSRSFPDGSVVTRSGQAETRVLIVAGDQAQLPDDHESFAAVLVELGNECLAVRAAGAPGHVFGFARFRLGDAPPTDLVELVKGEDADLSALAVAKQALEETGLQVSVCSDRVGRIVNRLIRPQFNLAFAALDDGLATRGGIESCVRSGLGYRKGLMDAVEAGGLEDHFDVCVALFQAFGRAQFAPPRQAIVAHQRKCNAS
ncbi:3-hydroxyacyl-CoA dehydrogenase family protein [Nitrospirillum viridazoti]|uniref:3-hydroxyacyl-CoA dehydrogenase family protein n=1 Tax=Nitrospirillum viridazoti TaxID=3144925 RepID=UPI0009D96389|nr:3-hydroxyacyl-CoA dehydrogenase family protein [Nitrospirillum amazonense]